MIIFYPNPEEFFKNNFPYPRPQNDYKEEDRKKYSTLARRWNSIHIWLGLLLWVAFSIAIMYLLQGITAGIYSLLSPDTLWFYQKEAPFAIAAMFISLPLAFLSSVYSIRFFHRYDHIFVTDLLNARMEFNSAAAWRWAIKPMSVLALIFWIIVAWCYVSVGKDGISVKNALAVTEKKYNFSDIADIRHYSHYSDRDGVRPYDHYALFFMNGQKLINVAPYIEINACIIAIAQKTGIQISEDSVDKN